MHFAETGNTHDDENHPHRTFCEPEVPFNLMSLFIGAVTDSAGMVMRGNRFYHEKDYPQALEQYKKALVQEHQVTTGGNELILWNIHNRLCATYTKLQDWQHVHSEADEMLKLGPDNPKSWIRKGGAFFFQGKTKEALEQYEKGTPSLAPRFSSLLFFSTGRN